MWCTRRVPARGVRRCDEGISGLVDTVVRVVVRGVDVDGVTERLQASRRVDDQSFGAASAWVGLSSWSRGGGTHRSPSLDATRSV
jgi:hypothetical protein